MIEGEGEEEEEGDDKGEGENVREENKGVQGLFYLPAAHQMISTVRTTKEHILLIILTVQFVKIQSQKIMKMCYGYSCLLYTSPSPRDATLSRMPSSA